MTVVYDAGALVAAERSDREVWAEHRSRLARKIVPLTTAPVVAQVSRSARQVLLRRFLRGCEVVPFLPEEAHEVGALAAKSGAADVVDVHVVLTAANAGAEVITSDWRDLSRITAFLSKPVPLFDI